LYYLSSFGPPLWSSGQSSWLQIQSGFDSRRYQIFWEVVCLEQGPLSLVSTIEELLGRKSSVSGLESREYGRWDPSSWPLGTLYPQKLALTSPKRSGRSVGKVRPRTQATEFLSFLSPFNTFNILKLHHDFWDNCILVWNLKVKGNKKTRYFQAAVGMNVLKACAMPNNGNKFDTTLSAVPGCQHSSKLGLSTRK
jgi:hypothetical protein